jgi:DNA-binding NarL/FixJ family response regulator
MWKGVVMANDNHGIAPAVRVLVVEDFEPFRRFVCSTLSARPHLQIVAEVSNGLDAVRKAEKLQPELILMDIGLARLDGIEAARQIRKLSPQSKIIFVTQEADPDVVREAFKLGAAGYVVKTSKASDLLTAVDAVLDGRQFLSSLLTGQVQPVIRG